MNPISLDAQCSDYLVYDQGGKIVVFDQTHTDTQKTRTVIIRNNTQLEWYGMTTGAGYYSLHFITESGQSLVRTLLLAKENHIQMTVHSTLTASHTLTNIHIISLAGEAGIITLNGVVEIASNIQKVSGHILEENIFLGSRGQIR
jgi:Fe-S cluster assembly scaffold protein SufB